jgi:hypothetical protein
LCADGGVTPAKIGRIMVGPVRRLGRGNAPATASREGVREMAGIAVDAQRWQATDSTSLLESGANMKLLEFELPNGEAVAINPAHVAAVIFRPGNRTIVRLVGRTEDLILLNSYQEIVDTLNDLD